MTTRSRVTDTRKPVTSRSGLDRADKARDTLQTAQAIMRASSDSGHSAAANAMQHYVDQLTHQIRAYFQRTTTEKENTR